MPEQPNYCTGCGKLMDWTNAAYYCSKECMDRVRRVKKLDDADIHLSDIPEVKDWSKAVVGEFYPGKTE